MANVHSARSPCPNISLNHSDSAMGSRFNIPAVCSKVLTIAIACIREGGCFYSLLPINACKWDLFCHVQIRERKMISELMGISAEIPEMTLLQLSASSSSPFLKIHFNATFSIGLFVFRTSYAERLDKARNLLLAKKDSKQVNECNWKVWGL